MTRIEYHWGHYYNERLINPPDPFSLLPRTLLAIGPQRTSRHCVNSPHCSRLHSAVIACVYGGLPRGIEGVPPGTYPLSAQRDGFFSKSDSFVRSTVAVTVPTTPDVQLTLIPGATVSGRILDYQGKPAVGKSCSMGSSFSKAAWQ
jgi:hypothetical protein